MNARVSQLLPIAGVAVLIAGNLLAWLNLQENAASAGDAHKGLLRCRQLQAEIAKLQQVDSIASDVSTAEQDIGAAVPRVLSRIQISEAKLESVSPFPRQQIEQTDYFRDDVTVRLRQVTVEEAIRFMIAVRDELEVKPTLASFRNGRSGPTESEQWDIELTLTRLLYIATSRSEP